MSSIFTRSPPPRLDVTHRFNVGTYIYEPSPHFHAGIGITPIQPFQRDDEGGDAGLR